MDLKDIKAIIDLMKKNSISEFEMEKGHEFKIKLKRGPGFVSGGDDTVMVGGGYPMANPMQNSPVASIPMIPAPAPNEVEIKSPMIGTFYRAPSPESAPYIEIGSEVNPDSVICIIEAMKVMNEIKAEIRGVVTSVLIDNAKPVEFGQPLFKVRPL